MLLPGASPCGDLALGLARRYYIPGPWICGNRLQETLHINHKVANDILTLRTYPVCYRTHEMIPGGLA